MASERSSLLAQALSAAQEMDRNAKVAEKMAASISRILRSAPGRQAAIDDLATKLSRAGLAVAAHAAIYDAAWDAIRERGDSR